MGNRVVIQKDEEPLAEIVGISVPKKGKRVAGLNRGKIRMSDDFDAPLPDEFWLGEQ
jgi:antitoxin (DNA-binding transcriptional repressor) of toxin-antitoxin stability system